MLTARNIGEAVATVEQRSFDLILICHSFSLEDRSQITSVLGSLASNAMILSLTDAYNSITADPPDTFLAIVNSAARVHSKPA